jgi:hypothetical protein
LQKSAHKGNKALKNLLVFSCNSLVGTKRRFGRYYDACVARGMRHSKALKAVARKMSEGHSKLEAIRCVKRYIARELYYNIIAQNRMPKTT